MFRVRIPSFKKVFLNRHQQEIGICLSDGNILLQCKAAGQETFIAALLHFQSEEDVGSPDTTVDPVTRKNRAIFNLATSGLANQVFGIAGLAKAILQSRTFAIMENL